MSFPLGWFARKAADRPRTTLALVFFAVLLSLWSAAGISLKTSNLDLVDPRLPEVERFLAFARNFGTPNTLTLVLEGPDPDALRRAVDALAPALRTRPDVRAVFDRLPLDPEVLTELEMDPYLASDDASMLFVFVQPRDPNSDTTTLAPFVAGVKAVIENSYALAPEVRVGFTGIPQYALDDQRIITRDISRFSLLTLVLVGILFVLGFRSLSGPLAATLVLVVAVCLTLGIVAMVPGHLTLVSALFGSMIFGLGIDHGIHIVHHFEAFCERTPSRREAIVTSIRHLERPLATALFTTIGVFLAMTLSGFKGFAELGFVAATGMLICYLLMGTLLPALLVMVPGAKGKLSRPSRIGQVLLAAQRRWVPPLLLLPLGAVLWVGPARFNGDYLDLQPSASEAVRLERAMVSGSDFAPNFAVFVRPDKASATELADQLREMPSVAEVRTLSDLDLFYEDRDPPPPPESFRNLFVDKQGQHAVYAYPNGDIWNQAENRTFLAAMRAIDERVTGMPFLGAFIIAQSHRALRLTSLVAVILLIVLVGLDFRHPIRILLAIGVPLLTLGATAGTMNLVGLTFNPLNVMTVPLILGISVDDAVHMIHRYDHEGGDLGRTLRGAGRGVVLTSLTTLAAFGTVILTSHRGLRSFSLTLCIGVTLALIISVVLLPWSMRRFLKPHVSKAGTDSEATPSNQAIP